MINPNAYFTVQAWMVNDLGLHGNELTLYAIIYGFSQDGRSEFCGSISYIQEWLGCSKNTALKAINSLSQKGLIKKKLATNGIDSNAYRAVLKYANCSGSGSSNSERGVVQFLTTGSSNSEPNNYIDNNIYNYIDKESIGDAGASPAPAESVKDKKPVKHKYGEYQNVLLTDAELDKLRELFPHDLTARIERLSEYIASSGKKYKSHYATIRSWANKDKAQQPARPAGRTAARGGYSGPVGPNGIAIDPNKHDADGVF